MIRSGTQTEIPKDCDVVVIGGGPAGSSAATLLARAGVDVVLLEAVEFPRNQVGESLIPHIWKFTDRLGVSEKIARHGFLKKAGGLTVWNGRVREIGFANYGYERPGLHVERDLFDALLLQHSRDCGARVFNPVVVRSADFSNPEHPKLQYTDKRGECNAHEWIRCRYVVDASGYRSFLASQFGSRHKVSSNLEFFSIWGYFRNSRFVGSDCKSHSMDELGQVAPLTFVMSHEDGWLWHIVLRDKTSVGLVIHSDKARAMKKAQREEFFHRSCRRIPYLNRLLAPAEFIAGSLRSRPDYSYYSTNISGDNYFAIGDAAGFVDPIFSHGVQSAFFNAAAVALAVQESLKNRNNRQRYSELSRNMIQQFYGFSRALSLGDSGVNGVNIEQVRRFVKSLSPHEMALVVDASTMTNRSENIRRIVEQAGLGNLYEKSLPFVQRESMRSLEL